MIRIVIAEDEEEVRVRLTKFLNASDSEYTVIGQAEDGSQALELVRELRPDILLTDICMPEVSGLELIHAVRETDEELPIIVVSGYDEFSYAQEAMSMGVREYLLKPFLPKDLFAVLDKTKTLLEQRAKAAADWKNMNDELQRNLCYSRQRFFHSLLRGQMGWQEREVTAGAIGFDLQADWFCAGLLDAVGTNADDLMEQWGQCFVEQNPYCQMCAVPGEPEHIALFFAGREQKRGEFLRQLMESLEPLCRELQLQMKEPVRCALGRPYQSCDELELSYKEALDTWRVSLSEGRSVQAYPLEPGPEQQPQEQIDVLSEKLLLDIQMGDKISSLTDLDELVELYAACSPALAGQISVDLLKLVLQIAELMKDVAEQEVAWSEQNLIGYLRQHFSTVSLRDARTMLAGYVERCCDHFAKRHTADSDKLIYRACMIIEANLSNEDFDLELLAQGLYFSPTYIRQLFKTKKGESFSDYLFRRRMEMAGQLMRNQALKVQDIAEQTGYKDQRYFARCFKKFYHCTPTEYRNQSSAP